MNIQRLSSLALVLLCLLALPVMAQDSDDDTNNTDTIETVAGTPTEICEASTPVEDPASRDYAQPEQVLETDVDYRAVFCTSAGAIYVDLLETYTPETVNNFVFLADEGYYNNTIFHRVIEDFMAQAGDPTGTGSGGPGYQFGDEIVGFLAFDRPGLLAMANAGPGTNGSQFFITTAETPWLNGNHTIFGEVLEGQTDVVENIELRDPSAGGDATSLDTVVIVRDPSLVDSTFEPTAEVATADTFASALDTIAETGGIPEDVTAEPAATLDTDGVVALVAEDAQEDYATFLETYGHDYRVTSTLDNAQCNASYFFVEMVYSVDAFANTDSASDALEDDFLGNYYESIGYEAITSDGEQTVYAADIEACASDDLAVTIDLQRGRYIANLSVVFPAGVVEQIGRENLAEIMQTTIAPIFEQALSSAYASELR